MSQAYSAPKVSPMIILIAVTIRLLSITMDDHHVDDDDDAHDGPACSRNPRNPSKLQELQGHSAESVLFSLRNIGEVVN